jgi:hypothetical protein
VQEILKTERPAGEDQLIVTFVNRDEGAVIDVESLLSDLASDAAAREEAGWRLVSVGGLPMRQMGTAGQFVFDSGGQFATQVVVVAVYARSTGAGTGRSS